MEGTLPAFSVTRSYLEQLLEAPRCSSLYRTSPQGDTEQDEFWNAAVCSHWTGTPEGLLERLLMWESGLGRVRNPQRPKGPRLLDLDLLLVGNEVRQTDRLWLPHPRLPFRRFALEPLVELEPESRDPVSGQFWKAILAGLPGQGVDRTGRTW